MNINVDQCELDYALNDLTGVSGLLGNLSELLETSDCQISHRSLYVLSVALSDLRKRIEGAVPYQAAGAQGLQVVKEVRS